MPQGFVLTCDCGYDVWLKERSVGERRTCPMCDADLVVSETNTRAIEQQGEASPFEAEGGSGAGVTTPPPQPIPPERTRPESAGTGSPFEGSPPTQEPAEPPAHETPMPDVNISFAPDASYKSPFEDDEPAETPFDSGAEAAEARPSDPYDTARLDQELSARDPLSPPPTAEQHRQDDGVRCTSCGREFRGDWDRITTASGTICYICANQVTTQVPGQAAAADREETRAQHAAATPAEPDAEPIAPTAKPQPRRQPPAPRAGRDVDWFRGALWIAALGTIGITLILVFMGEYTPPSLDTAVPTAEQTAEDFDLPGYAVWLVRTWRIFAVYFGLFLTIFLVLDFQDRLPHEHFFPNIVLISWVIVLITGILMGVYGANLLLAEIFVAGQIWMMLVSIVAFFAIILVLINVLDFGFKDFALCILFFMVSEVILQIAGLAVYAAIAQLAA